jgi:hypothetical protein
LLHLQGLASNLAFAGVSARREFSFVFYFQLSLRASSFGKGLISTGLTIADCFLYQPDAEGSLLKCKFEFEVW